jgi:hypothetical protein
MLRAVPATGFAPTEAPDEAPYCEPSHWLEDTEGLQCEHPAIRLMAQRLTQLHRSARGRAVACFGFVRSLPFRWPPGEEYITAPEVLKRGWGDCFAKGTLFVSLLRSVGIPARLRVAAMPSEIFDGLLATDQSSVMHAYVEVMIGASWLGVDAHVMDGELALAARMQLHREKKHMGYGLHARGEPNWDGEHDAFNQFVKHDPASAPCAYWGPFHDSQYAIDELRHWRGTRDGWLRTRAARVVANRRVAEMRRAVP